MTKFNFALVPAQRFFAVLSAVVLVFSLFSGAFFEVQAAAKPPKVDPTISVTAISDEAGNDYSSPFPTFECDSNPLYGEITISGSGVGEAPPGNIEQYGVAVDWGDATSETAVSSFTPNSGHAPFSYTFSAGAHAYASDGDYTIVVSLYHTNPSGNDNQTDATFSVPICIQTEPPATLTVVKELITDDGAVASVSDFSFQVNGGDLTPFEGDGSNEVLLPVGTVYSVSESATGFSTLFSAGCAGTITAQGAMCTVTNNDNPAIPVLGCMDPDATNYNRSATEDDGSCTFPLTVTKQFGGETNATPDQFSFIVNDGSPVTFEADGTNVLEVQNGVYTIVESAAEGFTTIYSGCTEVMIDGAGATCTVTNTPADQTLYGTLVVTKVISGETNATPDQFTFAIDGGEAVAFESDGSSSFLVPVGTHTVVESVAPGFVAGYENCTDVIVEEDQISTCTITNTVVEAPVCEIGENLLANGSFEEPVIEGSWGIFNPVANWLISLSDGLEIWQNFMGGPSDGVQNVELDGNAPTQVTQPVVTTPGATYELHFDFSPRPATGLADNSVNALWDGNVLMSASGDGSNLGSTSWTTHSGTFVAADASTDISFVDVGEANSVGSLIDNAVLCLVSNPSEPVYGCMDPEATNYNSEATEQGEVTCIYDDSSSDGGGGGNGRKVELGRGGDNVEDGEVLGESTTRAPGEVLGESISPLGAPNTGAGGAATGPLGSLFSLFGILLSLVAVRVTKNG